MGNLKSLAFVALLLSFSLTVFADTSKDTTHAKDEVKPSEATDVIEPQPQAVEAKAEPKDAGAEPQQIGFCRFGCCGTWFFAQCSVCCPRPQTVEAPKASTVETNVVEPQAQAKAEAVKAVEPQKIGGGCSFGCCGVVRHGRCNFCCARPQAEAEVVEPQRRGCRYGCCGSYANGQCSACCSKKMMATEQNRKKKEEAKP